MVHDIGTDSIVQRTPSTKTDLQFCDITLDVIKNWSILTIVENLNTEPKSGLEGT